MFSGRTASLDPMLICLLINCFQENSSCSLLYTRFLRKFCITSMVPNPQVYSRSTWRIAWLRWSPQSDNRAQGVVYHGCRSWMFQKKAVFCSLTRCIWLSKNEDGLDLKWELFAFKKVKADSRDPDLIPRVSINNDNEGCQQTCRT